MKIKFKKIISLVALALVALTAFMPTHAARTATTTVSGIPVYVSSSVSDSNYNTFIAWVKDMPDYLKTHIASISVVDDMTKYTIDGADASGVTRARNIYIKAGSLTSRKGTLYHEAAHCLDFAYSYSNTSTWEKICKAEWSGAGHYSTPVESFAEAVSHYYVDGLTKTQSKKAIQNIINIGWLTADEFTVIDKTIYTNYRAGWIYPGPSDYSTSVIATIPVGGSAHATGINKDKTWYRISYNGTFGYIRADMVSTTRDPDSPFVKVLLVKGTAYEVKCTSGTYKEICQKIESLGYKDYTLKNSWGTTVYSWYGISDDTSCYCLVSGEEGYLPSTGTVYTVKVSLNGSTYSVKCSSGTYSEVWTKIKAVAGNNAEFTVKNQWGNQVYSWYNVNENGSCSVTITKAGTEDGAYVRTLSVNGKTYSVSCTSGTYKEVFDKATSVLGTSSITVKDQWGSDVYSWYNVTENGKCTATKK